MADKIVLAASDSGERPPIRVAFCITDLDVGGAERMFVELVTRLDRRRWEPKVFCLSDPGALVERLQSSSVPVICFDAKSVRDLGVIRRLAAELRNFRPVLLQSFLFHANLVGRIAAWWARVPFVICGIRVAERRSRVPLWLDRLTQGFVDHNVCVSQAVAEFSIRHAGLKESKVSVIANGVDFPRFATATPVDRLRLGLTGASLVLFVGRLDTQKAPFVLLEAFERLIARHADWQLLIVGEGPLRRAMTDWIENHGLKSNVHLVGWRPDIPDLLKAADVLVLPSLWEGMPNIVLESMAAGLPVVVSRVEGTDELIRDGETGLLATPGSVNDFERQIERILIDSKFSARLSETARQAVFQGFLLNSMIDSYEQLYLRLFNQRRAH